MVSNAVSQSADPFTNTTVLAVSVSSSPNGSAACPLGGAAGGVGACADGAGAVGAWVAGACAAGVCAAGACAAAGGAAGACAAGGEVGGAWAAGGVGVAGAVAAGGEAGVAAGGVVGVVEGAGVVAAGGVCDRPGIGASQSSAMAATAILVAKRFRRLTTRAIRLSIGESQQT